MFISQRLIAPRAFDSLNRPTISREAARAHAQRSAWTNGAEMQMRREGARFVVSGAYDRSAIMRAALSHARTRQRVNGAPWAVCPADALRGAWKLARAQPGTVRPATKH